MHIFLKQGIRLTEVLCIATLAAMPIFLALSSTRKKVTALERNSHHGALWLSHRKWGDKDTGLERGTDGTTQRATSVHSLRMRESLRGKRFSGREDCRYFLQIKNP